jgi:hypothetical protein
MMSHFLDLVGKKVKDIHYIDKDTPDESIEFIFEDDYRIQIKLSSIKENSIYFVDGRTLSKEILR